MPNIRLIREAVKPAFRHEQTDSQTDIQTDCNFIYRYIYKDTVCLCVCFCVCVCLCVCSCLNAGLTAARINLIFGMHTHIWSDCAIGYMILTFEVIKSNFRSKKFLCKVPSGVMAGKAVAWIS